MQAAELKAVRCAIPELSFSAEQQVLRRLDKTFKAFFARGRGFPRFRATARYHAADFRVGDGLTIRKSERIGFVGVPGAIKVRWHRELPGKPASAILTRQNGKWSIVFHVEVEAVDRAGPDRVGIDLGKAASAGGKIVRVDPRGTSQTCPACGSEARKRLSDRVHRCACGCTLDRDVAAAKVVHVRAFGFMPGTGSGALSERVAA